MAAFNKHFQFVEDLAEKVHNLGADALRCLLTNVAPTTANAIKSALTEITAGFGYVAGGPTPTISSSVQTGGVYKLTLADTVITAAGGSIGPFRYIDLWNDTPTSPLDPLIGWWDYGASITLLDTESLTLDFDGTNGVIQLA